uniref:C2H2-type domain-containing protein n=1 Tax=Macrostomum lignano TaxID=282301 RepID=A0A1I8GB12_9PLAT
TPDNRLWSHPANCNLTFMNLSANFSHKEKKRPLKAAESDEQLPVSDSPDEPDAGAAAVTAKPKKRAKVSSSRCFCVPNFSHFLLSTHE